MRPNFKDIKYTGKAAECCGNSSDQSLWKTPEQNSVQGIYTAHGLAGRENHN